MLSLLPFHLILLRPPSFPYYPRHIFTISFTSKAPHYGACLAHLITDRDTMKLGLYLIPCFRASAFSSPFCPRKSELSHRSHLYKHTHSYLFSLSISGWPIRSTPDVRSSLPGCLTGTWYPTYYHGVVTLLSGVHETRECRVAHAFILTAACSFSYISFMVVNLTLVNHINGTPQGAINFPNTPAVLNPLSRASLIAFALSQTSPRITSFRVTP